MSEIILNLCKEIKESLFVKVFFIYQFFTRIFLFIYASYLKEVEFSDLPLALLSGVMNDIVTCSYGLLIILIINICFFYPMRLLNARKILIWASFILLNIFLLFNMLSELMFWEEYSSRYNFIAVDYLIYTNEIINTLKESSPLGFISTGFTIILLLIILFSKNYVTSEINKRKSYKSLFVLSSLLTLFFYYFYEPEKVIFNKNNYAREIAKNGPYEFIYAFFNNELDYKKFYPSISDIQENDIIRKLVKEDGSEFTSDIGIEREITGSSRLLKDLKTPNIVVIVVESLSAEYLGVFGNDKNLTPYLDNLSKESVFFANAYATGTRTVRGLEAIVKSIPPTPGSSIVRRPNNENLYTISTILKPLGYSMDFVYGGYSYFDGMKYFFSNNGFDITDRSDFSGEEISFANVWGIADGDVFKKFLKLLDKRTETKKPFFSLFLTTSNHRPYTFPDGVIDMPQGSRASVVRYTDYTIGEFIENAKTKPWFDNTIFVIVADHCASSAGRTKLPINKYHIPIIMYAPKLLKPQKVDYMVSQIDIMPTILGVSGINYISKFYGVDALATSPNRAFIGTYQLLGYLKNGKLAILSPNKEPYIDAEISSVTLDTVILNEAISFYSNAYNSFKSEQEKER